MNPQSLMFFEAEAVAAETAKCEAQRAADRHEREAREAARALAKIARDKARAEEEAAKSRRRFARAEAYKAKHPPGHAQCGIRWYPAGSGWTHCHGCGQALIYTTDPNAKPQECKGRR
jgi:hypothetical protein